MKTLTKTNDLHLVYTDDTPEMFKQLTSVHNYYCGDCGEDWSGTDAQTCPFCHSDNVVRLH